MGTLTVSQTPGELYATSAPVPYTVLTAVCSSVSSAIVQRYLDKILEAALSQNGQIQAAAVDILTFTIKQGLAHPLQSFPVIVALETSPSNHLSSRASALHAILHAKHTSLLNSRYVNSARASFDYQKRLNPDAVKGYRMLPGPSAMLQRWYTLAREKRATKLDFLRALVKVFDVELGKSSQVGPLPLICLPTPCAEMRLHRTTLTSRATWRRTSRHSSTRRRRSC